MTQAGTVKVDSAIEIQVVFDREGGRAFQMRLTPLALDIDKEELNQHLDKVLAAVERQRTYYELLDEQERLETQLARIDKYEKDIARIEATSQAWWETEGKRGEWKLNPNERTEREKLAVTISRDRVDATDRRDRIEKLRKRIVNGHAPERSANSHSGMSGR